LSGNGVSQPSNYVVPGKAALSSPQNEEDSRNSAGLSLKYALRQQGNLGTKMVHYVPWISESAIYRPYDMYMDMDMDMYYGYVYNTYYADMHMCIYIYNM
jgi:hypothetical protein